MSHRFARLTVAALAAAVGVAVGAAVPAAPPAAAAACTGTSGVSVVVDFNQLGGGVPVVCVPDSGTAASLFAEAGFPLTYAQRQPGFVCRVSGVPTSDPCQNTAPEDAYWGLWWSTGDPGAQWTFSSLGAASLRVPDGALVAFAWDERAGRELPSAPASRPAPSPAATPEQAPTSKPTPRPTRAASPEPRPVTAPPTTPPNSASPVPTDVPTDEPTEEPGKRPSRKPSRKPGTKPATRPSDAPDQTPSASTTSPVPPTSATEFSDDPVPTAQPATVDDGGMPTWVGLLVAAVLFVGAGVAVVLRRRPGS